MGVGKGGTAGKAEAMMRTMGWKEGEALGRNAERPIVSAEEILVGARLSKNTAGLRAAGEAAAAGVGGAGGKGGSGAHRRTRRGTKGKAAPGHGFLSLRSMHFMSSGPSWVG